MDLDTLRTFCNSLPAVEEDVKWESDLCFMIGKKIFCITGFNEPVRMSFKATEKDFDELVEMPGISPASYLARYKWVSVEDANIVSRTQMEHYITKSYELVKAKLQKKILKELGLLK